MASKDLANLLVRVGADLTQYDRQMMKLERSFERQQRRFQDWGQTLTTGVTLPLGLVGVAAGKLAMDAGESENLFTVSMGKMAGAARAWSEELREQLGLNAYALRKNVGIFYNMFTSMKLPEAAAYELSTGLTKLAQDMASFYNISADEAFEKLSAGITGEIEPLKRLGILVNEETVKQYAYAKGIAAAGAQLTEQQKVMARYAAIMEQTKNAQGDLARTLDSPTNQLRILTGQITELGIEAGQVLLPVVRDAIQLAKPLIGSVQGLVAGFRQLDEGQQRQIINWILMAAAAGPVLSILGGVAGGIANLVGATRWGLGALGGLVKGLGNLTFALQVASLGGIKFGQVLTFLGVSPAGLATAAILGLVSALGYLYVKNRQAEAQERKRQDAVSNLGRRFQELDKVISASSLSSADSVAAQEEQKKVIQEIGQIMPKLVTVWDAHGNAVAIDTARLRENTRATNENAAAKAKGQVADDYQTAYKRLVEMEKRRINLEKEITSLRKDLETNPDWILQESLNVDLKQLETLKGQIEEQRAAVNRLGAMVNGAGADPFEPSIDMLDEAKKKAAEASKSVDSLTDAFKGLIGVVAGADPKGALAVITDAGAVAARRVYEATRAIGNFTGAQTALAIMEAAGGPRVTYATTGMAAPAGPAVVAASGPAVQEHRHSGTLRVEGVNDEGETVAAVDYVIGDELHKNQDRYSRGRSQRRQFR